MWFDGLTPLRFLLRALCVPVLLLGLAPTLLSINRIGRSIRVGGGSLDEFMVERWSYWLCRVFGVRVRVLGDIHPAPTMIVANHLSWLDIQAMHAAAPMGFVGKAEINRWPVLGYLARAGDTIFIERGSHSSSADVSLALVERLNAGRRVAIFPEGGIRPGGQVGVFHARLFKAAVEADCLIQPVMMRYVRKGRRDPEMTFLAGENMVMNMLRMLGRPVSDAEVRFLAPFAPAGRPRRDLARQAQAAVAEAFEGPVHA
jgi:1-acyl-sn-glycerol-3-phosphate acyltransferase